MINSRRVLVFMTLYLVWAVLMDLAFNSADRSAPGRVPIWMTIGFAVSAVVVAAVVLWYLIKRKRGEMPVERQQTYTALLVGIVVSGVVIDSLKGLASMLLGGHPWWILLPIFAVGYATCWAVLSLMLDRRKRAPRR